VAATNKDLTELIKKGLFREDLYYRINVVTLTLPPLRERREDIPLLVNHFLERFNRLSGKEMAGVSQEVLSILMAYDFPGNVRELENIIEHATVLCQGGLIEGQHLPDYLQPTRLFKESGTQESVSSKRVKWADLEREFILQALRGRQTLWRRVKRLNIQLPKKDGRFARSKDNGLTD